MRFALLLIGVLLFSCQHSNKKGANRNYTLDNWAKLSADYGFDEQSTKVFIAFDKDCPLCKWYQPVIVELYKKFASSDIDWYLIRLDLENADSLLQLDAGIREISIASHTLSYALKMSVTPEVVVVSKNGKVLYRGKIDDRAVETGKHAVSVNEKYLDNVLSELRLVGDVKNQPFTEAKGCFIEYEN